MTTTQLHQLFKVSYDKENVITSYPSVLSEEIDVFLNQSYLMIVNQKFTGNNVRNVAFEGDVKRIDDLRSLIKTSNSLTGVKSTFVSNAIDFSLSTITDYLHFISGEVKINEEKISALTLVSHNDAQKFKETVINKPWIPNPICTLSNDSMTVYYDNVANPTITSSIIRIDYLKRPAIIDIETSPNAEIEVSDEVANEIVSMAVYLALENIESRRAETKGQTLILQE